MSSEVMDAFWRAPPMARTLASAILITSMGIYFGPLPSTWFYFTEDRLFRLPPEIWRLASNFLLSGPKLSIVMDPYFVFQYLGELETTNPRFPTKEAALWYLMTVGGFIIILNRAFLGGGFFLQALLLALCYTSVQDQRGMKANFFFFQVPAQTVPYCMILVGMLSSQSPAAVPTQLSGIVAAHLYDFLTRLWPEFGGGPNLLPAPGFLSRLVTTPRVFQREYGTAIRGGGGQTSGSSTGASAGSVLPDSWKTRGSGHRLG
ncbi:Der1-like family-domain-containing protein [Apodospora peruviana]|uniref:Derlin n=1 Tax=Apodospora peruviana TaxID=516989 RepID=A0AAE0IKK1_9PEZI|nr:Der1-like family-domain-containing protein [Apodospora peruviana]